MTISAALNASRRTRELAALADGRVVDVVVIGGGITGTGIALDAAARGLSVALVEKHDLAFGTGGAPSSCMAGCDTWRRATSASQGAAPSNGES
jgi:glycerol-3-phosphate dehydrogenase